MYDAIVCLSFFCVVDKKCQYSGITKKIISVTRIFDYFIVMS